MEDPKPVSASTTQAPTLEDDIREIKIASLGDKIVEIGDEIRDMGKNRIAPLIEVAGKEAELAEWKEQQAKLEAQQAELKSQQAKLEAQLGPAAEAGGFPFSRDILANHHSRAGTSIQKVSLGPHRHSK